MSNPLLSAWDTPFQIPPFSKISDDDFDPGLKQALNDARAEIADIRNNPENPTFENTIEALELMGEGLEKVLGPFFALAGSDSNPKRQSLQREFAPLLSGFFSEMTMDHKLFSRVKTLWDTREDLNLSPEQNRVLYLRHRGFVRSGAELQGADAERLKEILYVAKRTVVSCRGPSAKLHCDRNSEQSKPSVVNVVVFIRRTSSGFAGNHRDSWRQIN